MTRLGLDFSGLGAYPGSEESDEEEGGVLEFDVVPEGWNGGREETEDPSDAVPVLVRIRLAKLAAVGAVEVRERESNREANLRLRIEVFTVSEQ